MDLSDVIRRVELINSISDDAGNAHSEEDSLYFDFVIHMSHYDKDQEIKAMAKEVLKTNGIDFSRRYA